MVRADGAEPVWQVRWHLGIQLEDFSKDMMGFVPPDQAGSHLETSWPGERCEVGQMMKKLTYNPRMRPCGSKVFIQGLGRDGCREKSQE